MKIVIKTDTKKIRKIRRYILILSLLSFIAPFSSYGKDDFKFACLFFSVFSMSVYLSLLVVGFLCLAQIIFLDKSIEIKGEGKISYSLF